MPISPRSMGRVGDWNRMIDVNIRGVLHGIHSILDHMMARGSGTIINIASTAAHESSAAGSVYSATKYAVKAISEGLRKERSEEHTSELQSLMRISYAVFCLKKKKKKT